MTRLFSKRLLVAFTTLFFVAGGYTALWFMAAENLEGKIVAFIQNYEAKGYVINYRSLQTKGFPLRVIVEIECFNVTHPDMESFSIDSCGVIQASANIWKPSHISVESSSRTSCLHPLLRTLSPFNVKSGAFSANKFQLNFNLNNSNYFQISLDEPMYGDYLFDSLVFNRTEKDFFINLNDFKYRIFEHIPQGKDSLLLKVNDELLFKKLTLSFNADFPTPTQPLVLKDYLKTLYDHDAIIDFKQFEFVKDKLRMTGNGALSLSQDLQPILIMSTQTYNADSILTLLVEKKMIHKNLKPILKVALLGTAEQDKDSKEPVHKISINIQDQELSIANIPITKFKEINWDTFTWQAK